MNFRLPAKLATALFATFALMPLQTSSVLAQSTETATEQPVLGFIVLGKTTVAEAQKKLEESKCVPEYSYFYGVQFTGTCLGLPHEPSVRFLIPTDKMPADQAEARAMHREPPKEMLDLPITTVQLGFWEYAKEIFNQYLPLISKTWGEPQQCEPPKLEAKWDCNGVEITMRDDKITFTTKAK